MKKRHKLSLEIVYPRFSGIWFFFVFVDVAQDMDVSIRKRALELSFALINSHNIRNVMIKLLKFLEKSDPEFKAHCSSNIVLAAEKYAQNVKWHLDTLLKVLVAVSDRFCSTKMETALCTLPNAFAVNAGRKLRPGWRGFVYDSVNIGICHPTVVYRLRIVERIAKRYRW